MSTPSTPNPPIVFAILRNVHESFRKSIAEELSPNVETNNENFRKFWKQFEKVLHLHAIMEDSYVFPLLDEISEGKVTNDHIPEEHVADKILTDAIDHELKTDGEVKLETFNQWKDHFLAHLQHEEKIMTPITPTIAPTAPGRAEVMHRRVVLPMWQASKEDFLEFIGWNVRILSTYGSTANTPSVACRVFVHGLQWAVTPSQWALLLPVIKANVTKEEIWEEMVRDYHIEMPGYQPELKVDTTSAVLTKNPAPTDTLTASPPEVKSQGCKCIIS